MNEKNLVLMHSEEYGFEWFEYETRAEARQGFKKLCNAAQVQYLEDGVVRTVLLVAEKFVAEDEPHSLSCSCQEEGL